MPTDTHTLSAYLQATWQAPAASPGAIARILQAASDTPQISAQVASRFRFGPIRFGPNLFGPVIGLAAAASFALAILWTGMGRNAVTPPLQTNQNALLDDEALTYVFSNQSTEELL
jgi:hypothetical protein